MDTNLTKEQREHFLNVEMPKLNAINSMVKCIEIALPEDCTNQDIENLFCYVKALYLKANRGFTLSQIIDFEKC